MPTKRLPKITVEEAVAQTPGAKVIRVSDEWLASVRQNVSVFTSLYLWLIHEHGVTDSRRDLHNRTCAGKELMTRLRAAEKERIRRRHRGWSAKEINTAVGWSNVDSGPQEFFQGSPLLGNALLVRPETSPA